MAYVPGYKNDIFVSYAHVDNLPLGIAKGWVETFIDNLSTKLAQKIGRTDLFKLWDDRLLAQNAPLTSEILDALKASATLVLVLSPGYLKSTWCQREKNAFYDLLRSKNRSINSVFVVHRDRVERESCPEEIRDLLGFRFWEERGKGREPRIAGEPVPLPDDLLYWGELSELAGKLSHGLEQLRGSAPIEPSSGLGPLRDPTEAPAERAKVFLAEVSDDLYKARKKLLGALDQAGAEVFPKAPYPDTAVEYEQAFGRDLGGCSLFVQLLSDRPGRRLHGSTKTIVTVQLELAQLLNKTILQWRDRELDLNEVEEDSQRQILEGPSVMAITLEELQYEVLQKAFRKPDREAHAPVPTTGDALVFVHSDAIDQALVKEICEVFDREQIGWVVPSETESPERVRHEFEDLLLGCDALMLIYGQSPGGWVRQQLMNCRKLQHKRELPLRALAVFEGPPPANKGELGISLPSMRKLICHQGLDASRIAEFIEAVRTHEPRMTPHPYPGLRPFKREESDIFFGREQHVDQLLEKLAQHHFLAVVGTSGCGKSSLVKAGMLPALDAGFLARAGAHWYVVDMRPGHRPMWALAESLLASQAFGAKRGMEPEPLALLNATLRRGPLGLTEALCETPLPERANLLVLVDQFEEIFRYRRDIDSQEADAFVALLVASARQREVNVYIALTMRSDFLGDCAVFLDLPETINESQFLAPRLTRDQRAAAITEPARVFGGDVEPGLVNRMLNDMGADPDQLPLMQHALMRMWDLASVGDSDNTGGLRNLPLAGGGPGGGSTPRGRVDFESSRDLSTVLPPSQPSPSKGEGVGAQDVGGNGSSGVVLTLEHYRSVGGFSEALSSHADEALAELKDEREKRIAERIFKRLTKREEGERDTRDPTTLRELVGITEAPADEVIRVINVFSQPGRSFLTPHLEPAPTPSLDTIIDISHESLIRQWDTLKNWVIDEAKSADTYLRLEETARLYRAKNADPYRGLDLQGALQWRKTEKPTDAWAKRYAAKGQETEAFEGAIAFLDESAKNRDKEQASQERRWRITFFSVCAVMIGFMIAAFYVGWLWQTAEAEQNKAVALKLAAEGQLAESRHSNQLQLHALLAIESTKRFPSPLANQSLRHALELMPRPLATMLHHDSVSTVSFSPDGKTLASGSGDNHVRVWDLATGKELQRLSHESWVNAVSFSHDGKTLASGSYDKTVRLWDLATGKKLQRWSHEDPVNAVSFSPDSKTLASGSGTHGGKDNTIRLWDLATGKELQRWSHEDNVNAVSFSPDGKTLASGSLDNTVRVWDLATGKELQRFSHERAVTAVSFSPDGKTLASGSGYTVRVWDLAKGKELQRWSHEEAVHAVSFSPDGKTLASGSGHPLGGKDSTIRLWDPATGKELQRWSHEDNVYAVSFSPEGKTLASGSGDKTMRVWDLATGKELRRWSHDSTVNAVSFSPDGKTLASGSASPDQTVRLWDLATGKELQRLSHDSPVEAVSFSPEGKTLASGSQDDTVRVWDLATEKELQRWSHDAIVHAVSFSPDGKTIASGSNDYTVRLWDLATGKELQRWSHETIVIAVSFSPDGKTLASGSGDNHVRVWDLANGKELRRWSHEDTVNAVSFSPDGKTLASGSGELFSNKDNTVRLWDLATGKELQRLSHDSAVTAVSFSPDGKTLASGSGDETVWVWDLATGKELQRLSHDSTVNAVSFSPDGKTLASGSSDDTARLWLWQPQDLIAAACERSTRNLRWNEWRLYFEDLPYAKTCERLPVHASVVDHAQQLAKAGNVAEATALFQQISDIEPSTNLDPSAEAERWERKGKLDKLRAEKKYVEWIEIASEAVQLDPTAVPNNDWNGVCWDGALAGQGLVVMRACDLAVERAGDDDLVHTFRDSRGLARALAGNSQGAIEDFEFYIEHTDNAERPRRQAWVTALKAGKNPFTPEVLKSLQGSSPLW